MAKKHKGEVRRNNTFESKKEVNIPALIVEILKSKNAATKLSVVGIDEAGRGAVIGPLVVAGVSLDENRLLNLEKVGVKDSKLLSRKKREELFNKIIDIADSVCIIKIPPKIIDHWVYAHKLNELEALAVAKILAKLHPFKLAIVDAPSTPQSYKRYLQKWISYVPNDKLLVEGKADKKYPVVAAASIIAKVIRDREVRKLSQRLNVDLGSGYPSDPKTRVALETLLRKHPDVIRHSWKTIKSLSQHQLSEWLSKES